MIRKKHMHEIEEQMHDMDEPVPEPRQGRQRGAALILTVVVIMVLTTLGMAMVAFTATEERSAVAYRDTLQTRMVAEAGVRLVQMAFATPADRALVPLYAPVTTPSGASPRAYDYYGTDQNTDIEASLNAIGIYRADRGAHVPDRYEGNGNRFFTGPFGGNSGWASAFGGAYSPVLANDLYDLKMTRTIPGTNTLINGNWLDTNINPLLQTSGDWNLNSGIITDISFYAAPASGGIQYGIATVRVTAEKWTGAVGTSELLARETIEAIIGDNNPRPAVLGNGDITFITQGGVMCGDGCEQIHANGSATVGAISGGEDPMVTASAPGTVTGGSGSTAQLPNKLVTPEINPWDLSYRPTSDSELDAYYLVTARRLELRWRNANDADNVAPRPCGLIAAGVPLSLCQDYNLEYNDVLPASSATPKTKRLASDAPYMYRYNRATGDWTECDSDGDTDLDCGAGAPTFTVARVDDLDVVPGTSDANDVPFNTARVPRTTFELDDPVDGTTVLVDGKFRKHGGGLNPIMTIIAVGSISLSASTTWFPAMANRMMWVSGRDIDVQANCCAPSNTCATNLANNAAQSIVASHEQIFSQSQTALAGIVIAENRVNFDTTVNSSTKAIDIQKGDHSYTCGLPDWPWELPTKPTIFSVKSATN